jgi:hypothetical protein
MMELLPSWCCSFAPDANPKEDSRLLTKSKPRKSRRQERSVKFAQYTQHGHGGREIDGPGFSLNSNPLAAQSSEFEEQTDRISPQDAKLAGAVPWSVLEANAKPPSDGIVHFSLAKPFIAEHYSQQEEKRRASPDQTLKTNLVSSHNSALGDHLRSKPQEHERLREQAPIANRVSGAFESPELDGSRRQQMHAQQMDTRHYLNDQPRPLSQAEAPGRSAVTPVRPSAPAASPLRPASAAMSASGRGVRSPPEVAFAPRLYHQRVRASSAASSSAASSAAGAR